MRAKARTGKRCWSTREIAPLLVQCWPNSAESWPSFAEVRARCDIKIDLGSVESHPDFAEFGENRSNFGRHGPIRSTSAEAARHRPKFGRVRSSLADVGRN